MFLVAYQRQVREHFRNMVTIQDGVVWHVSMYTAPGMPVRSLGTFRIELPSEDRDLANIRNLIERHRLHERPLVLVPPKPGVHQVTFLIQANEQSAQVLHAAPTPAPLPEPLADLEAALLALAPRAAASPIRAIQIESSLAPRRVRPGGEVGIALAFVNRGAMPAQICNPAANPPKDGCALTFFVWAVVAGGEPEYYDTIETADLEYLREPRRALRSDEPTLGLAPGERIGATLRFPCPNYAPGSYQLQLVYNALGTLGEEEELVLGGYRGDAIPIEIESPA